MLAARIVYGAFVFQDVGQLMVVEPEDFYMGESPHDDLPAFLRQVIATGRSNFATQYLRWRGTSCFASRTRDFVFW